MTLRARSALASPGGPAILVTAGVFALYLLTLSPSTAMWDAGEYIAAAKSLGIPHQPGNPIYGLVSHAFGLLPFSTNYAVRINVLAALCGAITAGLWFLCAERLLRDRVSATAARYSAAGLAALLGATAFTVWNQSVVMEKVYPLALVGLALSSWLMLRWLDLEPGRQADRVLALMAYLVGLGYAIHPAGLLTAPSIAIAVAMHRPRTLLRGKLIGVLAGAAVFGATPFAVLPLRAAHQPYINESAVSACENGTIQMQCTFSGETARRLVGTIQREQYGGNAVAERRAPFVSQVEMFWLYFKWQWLRDYNGQSPLLQSLIAAVMLVLGVLGLVSLRDTSTKDRRTPGKQATAFWYFAPLAASFTIALIYYLNFRYGYSQSPELGNTVPREPRDRDYFYMWTFSLWGLLAALGVVWVWRKRAVAVIAVALIPLLGNWNAASRRGQSFTREWASDLLNSVEPNAVLITNGDNDSFPLWYAQEVEGVRPDVTVTLTPYLGMEWYARQLNRRGHIWKLSDAELDTIPPFLESAQPMQFEHGDISTTIPPGYLTRDQLLVLRAIKDSFASRPIYFSFGPYGRPLGLDPYLKRVGLVQKLMPTPVHDDPDTVRAASGAYVDIGRSLELWSKYTAPAQLEREGKWVDKSTADVPMYYAFIAQDLAIALDARGDSARAEHLISDARRIVATVR